MNICSGYILPGCVACVFFRNSNLYTSIRKSYCYRLLSYIYFCIGKENSPPKENKLKLEKVKHEKNLFGKGDFSLISLFGITICFRGGNF